MFDGAAITMTVLPESGPGTVQDSGTNESRLSFEPTNGSAPEGSGASESMIPKLFPVYAFI